MVRLGNTTVATKTIPPRLAIAIKDSTFCSGDLKVSTADLDEWVVAVEVLPERSALEGDLSAGLQLGQIDGLVSRDGDAIEDDGST